MLNTYLFYALMFVVVGVPFHFQNRTQDITKEHASLPTINSLTAKLSALIIVALYSMSFLSFQLKNASYSKVGFCSCIFSFFLLILNKKHKTTIRASGYVLGAQIFFIL